MSKLEWYFIGLINLAALEYTDKRGSDVPAFWRWHHSAQFRAWIGHEDGPNRHPMGWQGWMDEFV